MPKYQINNGSSSLTGHFEIMTFEKVAHFSSSQANTQLQTEPGLDVDGVFPFMALPRDVQKHIFSFLNGNDRINASQVSKFWSKIKTPDIRLHYHPEVAGNAIPYFWNAMLKFKRDSDINKGDTEQHKALWEEFTKIHDQWSEDNARLTKDFLEMARKIVNYYLEKNDDITKDLSNFLEKITYALSPKPTSYYYSKHTIETKDKNNNNLSEGENENEKEILNSYQRK